MTRLTLLAASLAALTLHLPAIAQPAASSTVAQANQAATRAPTDASLVGALHEFAYERGALYAIEASPARITDIMLEPGESLLSVSAGDTTRWVVGDARSGTGASLQAHVLVKPNAAGLGTNLVLMTDRRVYHLELKSIAGPAMAAVSWRYPSELMLSGITPPPEPPRAEPVFMPETINLHYRLSGDKPEWRPLAVFDDGRQVYVEMPPIISKIEAPPLFISGPDGAEVVNYRIRGNFYIVDRLFMTAEMRLGTGRGARTVKIERVAPIGAGNE